MVRVDGHRVCLVRTSTGVHAIDNACPHEGYGMTQGAVQDDLITCAWHNWKFRVTDGACVQGEEDIRTHPVTVDATGAVFVTLDAPDPELLRPKLLDSLRRGMANDYVGQVSRDVVRLLRASTDPGELIWEAVAYGAPRAEFGWGHAIASATDCLAMLDLYQGDQRALPVVQGIAGIAESERGRPPRRLPTPVAVPPVRPGAAFRDAVEAEDIETAQSLVLGAVEAGLTADDIRPWFTRVVSDHHLSYGHGAIYSQKAFQLLERLGWDRAATVLPHLVPTLVYGTREDLLPYMRPFMKHLAGVDLARLAEVEEADDWSDDGALVAAMLGRDRHAPLTAAVVALEAGAGVDRLLDAVVTAVSRRLLRYDVAGEFVFEDDFGWLDITHGLTYANATRWHHHHTPGPEAVRLALFCVFLAFWTGRHEWHTSVGVEVAPDPRHGDLTRACTDRDPDAAVGIALHGDVPAAAAGLQRSALLDGATAFIVHAHGIKTARAAAEEATNRATHLPLAATARFLAAPRLERFVAATVTRSIDFVAGRVNRD